MFGLLNVRKPRGVTSRDVVNLVQKLVRPDKVGHAGTLDPLAEGVLVVCIGHATRLTTYVQQMTKRYRAAFLLGRSSPTDDIEGEVTETAGPIPSRDAILDAIATFVGTIDQRPPDYSAVKVSGRRAYSMARHGQKVELAARPVEVYRIELEEYEYPELRLLIECGSGTYVRALGRDLAQAVGTTAVMSELTRTAIGSFRLEDSVPKSELNEASLADHLLSPLMAFEGESRFQTSEDQCQRIANGRFIEVPGHGISSHVPAIDSSGELIAVLKPDTADRLRPELVFHRP